MLKKVHCLLINRFLPQNNVRLGGWFLDTWKQSIIGGNPSEHQCPGIVFAPLIEFTVTDLSKINLWIKMKIDPNKYHGIHIVWKYSQNKKVLLRKRKRHTDRHVASTPSVVLTGGKGVPQVPPHLDLARGIPHPWQGVPGEPPIWTWTWLGGTPSLTGVPLVPPIWTWTWLGVPHPWQGYPWYPPSGPGLGWEVPHPWWGVPQVPHNLDLARGYPIPGWSTSTSKAGWGTPLPHLDLARVPLP